MILDILTSLIEFLGAGFAFYRASHDAGLWLFQLHTEQTQNYMESVLIERGML